jgi:hypothetical protein
MKNTIYIIAIFIFALSLNSCFKDSPKNEMFKAAGSWKIESIEAIVYDTLGNQVSIKKTENYGILMLNHDDDFMFEGSFSYDFTQGDIGFTTADSYMLYLFGGGINCNTWSVTTDAKAFNLAALDPETLFVTYLYSATIEKLTSKKMVLIGFQRHPNGYLSTKETWNLVRATH